MKILTWVVAFLLILVPAAAQEQGLSTRNPLDEIRDDLKRVLSEAGVAFSEEQERSITLVLEESRRASEDLFGEVMNFSGGPPRGEQLDRAKAGIQWMNDDFSKRVRQYLNEEQLAVWDKHIAERKVAAEDQATQGTAGTKEQVQQIRINNNPFTAENPYWGTGSGGSYGFSGGGGVSTEIFQKGGAGAYHGTFEFRFRDESLNARNPFASNKPAYQQRNFNMNTSGPVIPNRLTLNIGANQTMQENVGTVNAQTPQGLVERGITRPAVFRNFNSNGTLQIDPVHSLQFGLGYGMNDRKNQGVGGFNLPERASSAGNRNKWLNMRHVWFMSERTVHDVSFNFNTGSFRETPATSSVAINVLDAFNSGGSQFNGNGGYREYGVRHLLIHTGERSAVRVGGGMRRLYEFQTSENNFLGTFTFSDLDSYLAGQPTTYRVTRGDPQLNNTQTEGNLFVQNELKISDRLTFFGGLRYEAQTNIADYNNFDPRIAFAYAAADSTVIRAGIGLFHFRLDNWVTRDVLRVDGARQYEILINNPSYPDPFQSGDVTIVPPSSRKVRAEDLTTPYNVNMAVSVERSLPRNLFVTASYDFHRGIHVLRSRNLNAPLPGQTERSDPSQGDVWQLESTGLSSLSAFRLAMRQRFSILNLNANYTYQVNSNDSEGPFSSPSNNHDLRSDWASVPRHQFNSGINLQLPLGAFLTTNINLNNGNPYNITTGKDDNQDGVINDRPAGIRRLSGNGPRFRNVSFNMTKSFRLGDSNSSRSLNMFANLNNAFNMTNLGTPSGVMTSSFFGKSFSAQPAREIEVGMRFQF